MIKVEDMNEQMAPYFGISPEKFLALAELIQKVLNSKDHAIGYITGNKGVGKTTRGKLISKKGKSFWPNTIISRQCQDRIRLRIDCRDPINERAS